MGTLVAAFLLLPRVGLIGTVWVGVAINLLVFLLAVVIAKRTAGVDAIQAAQPEVIETTTEGIEPKALWWPKFILPIMFFSGTTSFVYEVLWTRLLSHILGGSVAAFATMLASFLSGIAIGSAIASRFAKTAEGSVRAFVVVQVAIAVTSVAIYQWLYLVIPAQEGLSGNIWVAIAILLPATLFIGATFPLAVRIFASSAERAASSSANVYSWNTFGGIFGAAFAGFFLIPALKYEGAIKLVVLTNIFLGFAAALLISKWRLQASFAMGLLFVGVLALYQPSMPEDILRTSSIGGRTDGEILYYQAGRSSTVLMTREDGSIALRNNGLPEAGSSLRGAPPFRDTQQALATLPALIRPDAKSMLIVGLGGGVAVTGVPPTFEEIDVIELEPRVVDANRLAADLRVTDPLADPRLTIYINDARSALSLTSKRWDAIVSQPSHPWTAGASHLYTREYMQLAADHLTEDGVFLQWMAGQFISESLLRSLCATMLDVFDYVKVYQLFPETLFFVGSQRPMETELQIATTGRPIIDAPVFYHHMGIVSAEDLIAGLALDTEGVRAFAQGADLLTDNFNRMATESAGVNESDTRLGLVRLSQLLEPHMPLLDPNSWVHRDLDHLNFAHIAGRLEEMNLRRYSIALARTLEVRRNPQSLLLTGLGLRSQGEEEEAQRVLLAALAATAPGTDQYNQLVYAIVQPWIVALAQGAAPEPTQQLAQTLTGSAAAVIAGRAALLERDWYALAALDSELAQTASTDLWFVEATKLMVEWRNNLANIERRPDYAAQAWQIIDLAIAVRPAPDLFTARILAAYFADLPDELVETARQLTYVMDIEMKAIEDEPGSNVADVLAFRRGQITAVMGALQDMARRHNINPTSVEEVTTRFDELVARGEALSQQ